MAEQSVGDVANLASDVASPTIAVTIRYFAAARAAAGVLEERLAVPAGGPARIQSPPTPADVISGGARSTVGELLEIVTERHGPGMARVLARCSFLLDEVAVHGRQTVVRDGQVLDILPPFAGG